MYTYIRNQTRCNTSHSSMASAVPVPPYIAAPPTKEPRMSAIGIPLFCVLILPFVSLVVDFAELVVIDLQECATHEGRAKLAHQVRNAMSGVGFFYVINHGYTHAQVIVAPLCDFSIVL
jgi:hypothetical protein